MLNKLYKKLPLIIWLLIAVFLVRGFIYASFVPAWQGPDEPQHYDYIHYLQTERGFPKLGDVTLCNKVRSSLSSFYFNEYIRDRSPYTSQKSLITKEKKTEKINHIDIVSPNAKKSVSQTQRNQIIQHPPLYYILGAIITWPFKEASLLTSIFILRMFGLLLGLGVVVFTFLTVSLIFEKNRYPAYGATAFVALNPMFTQITTRVNNDALTNFLFALFLFMFVKIIKKGIDRKKALAIGTIIGIGLLTKIFFVLAFVLILPAFFLFRKKMLTGYQNVLVVSVLPIIISGSYYARNIFLYGVIQPLYKFRSFDTSAFKKMSFYGYLTGTNFTRKFFISFWSNFGWIKPRFTGIYYKLLFIVIVLALLGFAIYLGKLVLKKDFLKLKIVGLLAFAPITLIFVIAVNSFQRAKVTGIVEGVQGRYLFSLIGVIGLIIYLGIRQLLPIKRDYLAFAFITIGLLALDISAIFYHILPYFYF